MAGEPGGDLRRALEEEPVVVAHPVEIAAVLAEADAEEHIVRVVVGGAQEVRVVGGDHRQRHLGGEGEDQLVQLLLLAAGVVRLHLEVVAAGEVLGVPVGGGLRVVAAALEQVARDLPRHARRADDDPLAVLREQLAVHPRSRVEALGVAERGEAHEVLVADRVAREEYEMIVGLGAGHGARAFAPRAGGDVRLHADDRLELRLLGLLLELPRRVQVTMIGDRERRHLEFEGARDQIIDPVRPVEQGVLGVAVEMREGQWTGLGVRDGARG